MNIVPLIRNTGCTFAQFATAAGITEARLREIIFADKFTMNEWFSIEKALGLRPGHLSRALGKAPCDFVIRRPKTPGKIISIESRK